MCITWHLVHCTYRCTYLHTYISAYAYSVTCLCWYLLRFIKGFITRNQPPCPENMQFLEFVRTNWLNRLSKALPKNVLDKNWPSSPPACREASDILQAVYYRLMVRKYTRGLTEERKQQLQMKLEASDLFKGKKSCYEESVGPYFQQSHLSEYAQKHSEGKRETHSSSEQRHSCHTYVCAFIRTCVLYYTGAQDAKVQGTFHAKFPDIPQPRVRKHHCVEQFT